MTRALVWKELREQWAVGLTLALAAVAGLAALRVLMPAGGNRDELLTGVLWFAAWGSGLVCGSLLLAGEAEDGTQAFLDTLPATRGGLWWGKALTGLGLVAAQAMLIAAAGFTLAPGVGPPAGAAVRTAGALALGAVGYGWGLYCGAAGGSVLGAVARGVLLQGAAAVALFPAVVLALRFLAGDANEGIPPAAFVAAAGLVAAGVAARSRSLYCRTDRLRTPRRRPAAAEVVPPARDESVSSPGRRTRRLAVGVAVLGAVATTASVFLGVIVWPVATLVIGVLCGVTVLAGAGPSAASGRTLLARTGAHFALAVGAAALTALAPAAEVAADLQTSRAKLDGFGRRVEEGIAGGLVTQPLVFLALWLVYGYAIGVLCGGLFRRPAVAAVVALGVGVLVGGLWAPSVFIGGPLHTWQAWGPPALLLVAVGVVLRARAAGRRVSRAERGATGAAVVAAGALLAAALWYRAAEIPPSPDPFDTEAFRASLPPPEQNEGGRLTLAALGRLAALERTPAGQTTERSAPGRLPAMGQSARLQTLRDYLQRAESVADRGWGPEDAPLGAVLDAAFDDSWSWDLAAAADLPTGVVADPRDMTFVSRFPELGAAHTAAVLLVARGLQRQAQGDPAAFVGHLRTGLALARNLRHHTVAAWVRTGRDVESRLSRGVERWLERLDGRPDLMREALEIQRRHADEPPAGAEETRGAEFLVTLNSAADPADLQRFGQGFDPFFPVWALTDTEALRLAWRAPWENVRIRRALDAFASHDKRLNGLAGELAPPTVRAAYKRFNPGLRYVGAWRRDAGWQCDAPAALLQVALRLYQEEIGRPAERLEDLVPRYLALVPADPVDGKPFRYRISQGEEIRWAPLAGSPSDRPVRTVAAGQCILWSVGSDRRDDGGHTDESYRPLRPPGEAGGEDAIYLVPLAPGRR